MSWVYEQSTGKLLKDDDYVATGYAGKGEGKNNPDMQDVQAVGPLPRGWWTIGAPRDTPTHGPYVLTLTPDEDTETYGRSGFLMHGDSVSDPGNASLGCIIQARKIRERVWTSGDHRLEVVA